MEDIWFDRLEEKLKDIPVFRNPRRRKKMWEKYLLDTTLVEGDILEFGVYAGGSIGWFCQKFPDTQVYGFDSFEGLPEDWDLGNQILRKGHFSQAGKHPVFKKHANIDNINWVVGLFEDTIPVWRESNSSKIKILHIDCDLYSSTVTVLDGIKDRLQVGTYILWDELTHFPKDPQYKHNRLHEYKAFKEFCEDNPTFDFDVIARTDACQVLTKITHL